MARRKMATHDEAPCKGQRHASRVKHMNTVHCIMGGSAALEHGGTPEHTGSTAATATAAGTRGQRGFRPPDGVGRSKCTTLTIRGDHATQIRPIEASWEMPLTDSHSNIGV